MTTYCLVNLKRRTHSLNYNKNWQSQTLWFKHIHQTAHVYISCMHKYVMLSYHWMLWSLWPLWNWVVSCWEIEHISIIQNRNVRTVPVSPGGSPFAAVQPGLKLTYGAPGGGSAPCFKQYRLLKSSNSALKLKCWLPLSCAEHFYILLFSCWRLFLLELYSYQREKQHLAQKRKLSNFQDYFNVIQHNNTRVSWMI